MTTAHANRAPAPVDTSSRSDFALLAIPLRRPAVIDFLRDWHVPPRGARVAVVEQRPPRHVRDAWLDGLAEDPMAAAEDGDPFVDRLLATDTAMAHVGTTSTDRLVPRHFLDDDDTFLERNLGGWSPVWLGPLAVIGASLEESAHDPLLAGAERLATYGREIASARASHDLVRQRLQREFPDGGRRLVRGARALQRHREHQPGGPGLGPDGPVASEEVASGTDSVSGAATDPLTDPLGDLVAAVSGGGPLADDVDPLLAHDELVEQLVRLESARRAAVAGGRADVAESLARRQRQVDERWGLRLLLKGEYLMGRHRRSTVLLAEGAGVVVKQPAPEPRHAIDLAARAHDGLDEQWPRAVDDGAMVTPRRALADVVASGAVERLNEVFDRDVRFSTVLGLSIEPFAEGPTLADLARRRPAEMTADRYDEVLVHHLVCEALRVDNPDWHAANFMVTGGGLVHVDWGAARPIGPDERAPSHAAARLEQVRELAWSFQDEALAARVVDLHDRATDDTEHLRHLRHRAEALVA